MRTMNKRSIGSRHGGEMKSEMLKYKFAESHTFSLQKITALDIWYALSALIEFLFTLLILLIKSIDREDVELLLAIEKKGLLVFQ